MSRVQFSPSAPLRDHSSVVEQTAHNRLVAGSNPAGPTQVGESGSGGRASPCQGEGRGFNSRLSLTFWVLKKVDNKFKNIYYEIY